MPFDMLQIQGKRRKQSLIFHPCSDRNFDALKGERISKIIWKDVCQQLYADENGQVKHNADFPDVFPQTTKWRTAVKMH